MIEYFDGNCTATNTAPIPELASVISKSFMTVAKEFTITPRNAPTNPAFISSEALAESLDNGSEFWVYKNSMNDIIGCVSIFPSSEDNVFYIERLAVLPNYRHQGIGKELLDFACTEIFKRGGNIARIGIIEENIVLKNWYRDYGFEETSIRKVNKLPFTICVMEKILKATYFAKEGQLNLFSFAT